MRTGAPYKRRPRGVNRDEMARSSKGRSAWRWVARPALLAGLGLLAASYYVECRYADRIVVARDAPQAPVALVFGAGLSGQEPSALLAQRLDTAIGLYRAGKVRRILVSGDASERYHDESGAMMRYTVERGVPPADVDVDVAGLSTYDSCSRAKDVFGVERALLVTQRFHLPRALFIARSLGIDAHGVVASEGRATPVQYVLRELFSRPLALVMVLARPVDEGGEEEARRTPP